MKKLSTQDKILWIITIVIILSTFFLFRSGFIKNQSLRENKECSQAIITDFSTGVRGRHYLEYKFFVDEKEYFGSGRYFPRTDMVYLGDTIPIVYDRTNPKNNKTLRSFESIW